MTTVNDTVDAYDQLNQAFEALQEVRALAKPRGWGAHSFALEEATVEGEQEVKKSLFEKLLAFVKRFFDFILGRGQRSLDAAEAAQEKSESISEKFRSMWAKKPAAAKDKTTAEITTTYLARIQDSIVEDLTASLANAKNIQRFINTTVTVREISNMVQHLTPIKEILDASMRELNTFRTACTGSEDALIDYLDKPPAALKVLPTAGEPAKFSGDLVGISNALALAISACKTNISRHRNYIQQVAAARTEVMNLVHKATQSGNDSLAANLRTALIERLSPSATHVHTSMMVITGLYTEITNLETTLMRAPMSPKISALQEDAIKKYGSSLSKDKHLTEALVRSAFRDAISELLG